MSTELVILLDRSASMCGREASCAREMEQILEQQKKRPGPCWVTTLLVDTECRVLHDRLPIETVRVPERLLCAAGGASSLRDALSKGIGHIERIHRYLRKEDIPERVSFQILSDGIDNTSRTDKAALDRRMAEKREIGWEFRMLCPEWEKTDDLEETAVPDWDMLDGEGLNRRIEQTLREIRGGE